MLYLLPSLSAGALGPSKSIMTSSQHSASKGIAAGDSCLTAILRNRRHVKHFSTHSSISFLIVLHQTCLPASIMVFSAERCAPNTPTCRCRNTHLFQLMFFVAIPSGTTGTQRSDMGGWGFTHRSKSPSGAVL